MLRCARLLRASFGEIQRVLPDDVGPTLASEILDAKKKIRVRSKWTRRAKSPQKEEERKKFLEDLREKRQKLIEMGKQIPAFLLTKKEQKRMRTLRKLERQEPMVIRGLRKLVRMRPEARQYHRKIEWTTAPTRTVHHMHPLIEDRWVTMLRTAPRGMLRYHLREIVPVIDDRMKESEFHQFFDSTDINILKRKGYVFEGRDGQPLKLTLEELRLMRESEVYRRIDPRTKARLRWMVNRRSKLRSKQLDRAPTFKPLVYTEGDALAYFAYRTHPIDSVMTRIFGEVANRVPQYMPRSMLDFGAGWGTSILSAVAVWKGIKAKRPPKSTADKVKLLSSSVHSADLPLLHPRLQDETLRKTITKVLEQEVKQLEEIANTTAQKVEQGRLPSGAEVEAQDAVKDRKALLQDAVWDQMAAWKGEEAADTLDEDILGEGTYSGPTKKFEETDYFLEKEEYPKPVEAEELEKRGIHPDKYLRWEVDNAPWADDYYKHLEKRKMMRDPTYRPFAAAQYLQAQAKGWPMKDDPELQSSQLHADDTAEEENKAVVYRNWKKREKELLSSITAVEPSSAMSNLGIDFLADFAPNVKWVKFLEEKIVEEDEKQDLVVCAFTLCEMQSERLRADAIRNLWERCSGVLVIVEAGTPSGFKLVLDARNTILEEYKDQGPWEVQPTVLAPCPHDNLMCPVAHALAGHQSENYRTCFSASNYVPSFVERWVRPAMDGEYWVEQYSYCVIARNEVVPRKATRKIGRGYTPSVITENTKLAAQDERVQALQGDPTVDRLGLRRKVEDKVYQPDPKHPVPDTEFNRKPFVGRWYEHSRPVSMEEIVAVQKEVLQYDQAFRDYSWKYPRVVREARSSRSKQIFVDVCTPLGSLEQVMIIPGKGSYGWAHEWARQAHPGALLPPFEGLRRKEYILTDGPNTFAQPNPHLSPIRHEEQGKAEVRGKVEREPAEKAYYGEDYHVKTSVEADVERAKNDPEFAEEMRKRLMDEMKNM